MQKQQGHLGVQKQNNSISTDNLPKVSTNAGVEEPVNVINQAIADLENINAHLFSIEALMERIFDVKVPDEVEDKFREVAGELAPDPLNIDRLRLNRLLHQTPDLPDKQLFIFHNLSLQVMV